MGWNVVKVGELTAADAAAWHDIQLASGNFRSPYFHPGFTRAVGMVRDDVEIAIERGAHGPLAFFPFQRRKRGSQGGPVGSWLSDFHGVVAVDPGAYDAREMLRACGLRAWEFTHLPASQTDFEPYRFREEMSPYLDLSDGLVGFRNKLLPARREELSKRLRGLRHVERERGPLRFEFDARDETAFSTLLSWKAAQYTRAGFVDIFRFPWTRQLLETLHLAPASWGIRGVLSTLSCGNELWAAHFGLFANGVLHYWFPGHAAGAARWSPGVLLLLMHILRCEELGIQRIDFGKGRTRFKTGFMSGADTVWEGRVATHAWDHRVGQGWWRAKEWLRGSGMFPVLRHLKHHYLGWDGSGGLR